MSGDGPDTALARLLLARGAVDLPTLRAALDDVRAGRREALVEALQARGVARAALEQAETLVVELAAEVEATAPARRGTSGRHPAAFGDHRVVRELGRGGEAHAIRAHLRGLAGEAWAADLGAAAVAPEALDIDWRATDVAGDVIRGRAWWPGAP